MHTLQTATHLAHLDPMTGEGVLILPNPGDDLSMGGRSLHESGWAYVVRVLDGMGWEPSECGECAPCPAGMTAGGREVVGLFGRDPVIAEPSLGQCADAMAELLALARVCIGDDLHEHDAGSGIVA